MALTNIPTIKPPTGAIFIAALLLVIFVFFFLQPKPGDGGGV
ncbi:hypothetical protein WD019_08465 [Fictibacillus sp. Mic-4]|nr:hypothetical protein [Fictibacillus gelatini]